MLEGDSSAGAIHSIAPSCRAPTADLEVSIEGTRDRAALERMWCDLETRSNPSFFQSWSWIGSWLDQLPKKFEPCAVVARSQRKVVGLAIVVPRKRRRYGVIKTRGLHLNEAGDPYHNRPFIEYNGFLADREFAGTVGHRSLEAILGHFPNCDEIHLSGLEPSQLRHYRDIGTLFGLQAWVRYEARADFVDLAELRRTGSAYLDRISRNTRQQVRRALRRYGKDHAPSLELASTREEALCFLEALKEFHEVTWKKRGKTGAFSNHFFEGFHRTLITRRFHAGEIELSRVSVGGNPFGYLYNFRFRDRIQAYQSGFDYSGDPRLKPGIVSHYLAIERGLATGATVYDFMAGDNQHTRSLGTGAAPKLSWLVLQRDRRRFRLEKALLPLARRLTGRRS